jgi:phospholipid transport system substrate-binding protein
VFALVTLALLSASLGPSETLKTRDAEIRAALPPSGQEPSAAQRQKIENAVLKAVDIDAMAQDALGKNWSVQPKGKRKKFIDAFRTRFKQATSQQLDLYRSASTDYGAEQKVDDNDVKVPTSLKVKGEPTEVVYVMRKEKDGWRIVDIIVDQVSTIKNYQSTFNKIIAKEGFDGLVTRLQNASKNSETKETGTGGGGH